MTRQEHWNAIYHTKREADLSWFEALPTVSLEFLEAAGLTADTCVVDVGGGESRLVDALLARGLDCLAVLDVSGEALAHAKARLGAGAQAVTWIEADVTAAWSLKPMDIWHDRAVFHFLVEAEDRARYVAHLRETLKPTGRAIIATFALDGPATCSGLPVVRYSAQTLAAELGEDFQLAETRACQHVTPRGGTPGLSIFDVSPGVLHRYGESFHRQNRLGRPHRGRGRSTTSWLPSAASAYACSRFWRSSR